VNRIVLFDTTHHAMWAEEVAKGEGLGAEVVPAPEGVDAKCGLALEVLAADLDRLVIAMEKEGIPFTVAD
jgi:hypothetical protein